MPASASSISKEPQVLQITIGDDYVLQQGITIRDKSNSQVIARQDQFCIFWKGGLLMAVTDTQGRAIRIAQALCAHDRAKAKLAQKHKEELKKCQELQKLSFTGAPSSAAESVAAGAAPPHNLM